MPRQPNYYRILDVALSADQAQIQHAYRVLAKRYHPDRVPPERREWARAQMARINAAYEVLGKPDRRAAYDRQQGYVGPSSASDAPPRNTGTTRGRRHRDARAHGRRKPTRREPLRREASRREQMSRQHVLVLGSTVALGALLLGALYWWRVLASGLPQHRWAWAIVLSAGLCLVLVVLGRTVR